MRIRLYFCVVSLLVSLLDWQPIRKAEARAPSHQTQSAQIQPGTDQVIVVIWQHRIGITYDHRIARVDVHTDLANLSRLAGWAPTDVRISDARSSATDAAPTTSVDFLASGLDPRTRSFPFEPIVLTFRRFKQVGALFFVPPGYPYWGPMVYRTRQVTMAGEAHPGTYQFHFQINDPDVAGFTVPQRDPTRGRPLAEPQPVQSDLALRLLVVIGLSLALAAIVYGVATYLSERNSVDEVRKDPHPPP